jgi:hypothetical protein
MRALFIAAAMALVVPHAAFAGGDAPAKTSPDADPLAVELPMLVAPVTFKGRLEHYAYMRIILKVRDMTVAADARDRIPFLIDAFLRETHSAPIASPDNAKEIDGNALQARLRDAANRVLGEGAVSEVAFRDTIQTDDSIPQAQPMQAEAAPPPAEHAETSH